MNVGEICSRVVAMDDLISVLAEEMSALAQAIRVEQKRETQRRP